MLVFEFKTYGKRPQFAAIDDAIRTVQFIRNKCIRFWMDNPKVSKYDLSKQCAILAAEFPFANELNSMARQSHICQCGCRLDRDHNAAINILNAGLGTVGHTGTLALDTSAMLSAGASNALGDSPSTLVGESLLGQGESLIKESPCLVSGECQVLERPPTR